MVRNFSLWRMAKAVLPFAGLPVVIASCSGTDRQFGSGSGGSGDGGSKSAAGSNSTASSGGRDGAAGAAGSHNLPSDAGEGGMSGDAGASGSEAGANGEPAGSGGTVGGGTAGSGGTAASGGTAGSGTAGRGGTGGGGGSAPVVTVPTIVSVTPANSANGVLATTPIKITFSEAMDTTSVENALAVSSVASSGLTFGWGAASTVLTITATAGWPYAVGTSTSLAALKYTVTLGTAAKDAQGTAIGAAFSSAFSTRRRITHTIKSETAGSYSNYGHALGGSPTICASATDSTRVNKWANQGSAGTYYTLVTFDVSALGSAGTTNTIESATFRATQTAPEGTYYATHEVVAAKMAYRPIDDDVLDATVNADLGVFCQSPNTLNPNANILTSFKTDFDAGNKKHLFRLAPNLGGTDTSVAHFACGGFTLDVTQLVQ